MENAKTIAQLLDAAPLSNGDFLVVNQPGVLNPITQQSGDTRKVTVKQLTDYTFAEGLNEVIDGLEAIEAISDNDVLPINQQNNGDSNTYKATVGKLADYIVERVITERMPSSFLYASDKRKLTIKEGTRIKLPDNSIFNADQNLELTIANILDTGSLTNGKDYYLFLYRTQGGQNTLIASLIKTAPDGLDPADVVLIGGFHTLCASAGAGMTFVKGGDTKNHSLNDYIAADILPLSVWCLNHRPFSEPEGMRYVPELDFWKDIYLMSGSGINTKSAYQGAITRNRQYVDIVDDLGCVGKELLSDSEFAISALGCNEQTAVQGANEAGATSGGAGGRVDTAGRRMISDGGDEEDCGSIWQFLRTTSAAGVDGSIHGQNSANGVSPVTYGWIAMTQSAYGPYGQAGGKGSMYGICGALLAGGDWNTSANCGSRARHAAHARSDANAYIGGRGRSRALHG